MRMIRKIALAGVLATLPVALHAQDEEEAAEQSPEELRADIQRGVTILRSFNVAMNSPQLTRQTRGQIFTCLYRNPIRRISRAAAQVIERNNNLEADNPTHVYAAAIRACGITLQRVEGAGEDGASSDAPEGR